MKLRIDERRKEGGKRKGEKKRRKRETEKIRGGDSSTTHALARTHPVTPLFSLPSHHNFNSSLSGCFQ